MSTGVWQPPIINPAVFDDEQVGMTMETRKDPSRRAPRHMFSPFLTFDLKLDFGLVGFRYISRGSIRSFKEFYQRVRNVDAVKTAFNTSDQIQSIDTSDQYFERDAATIAEGLMRTYAHNGDGMPGTRTGLVVLDSLQGLDHTRPEDREFIEFVKYMLWPENLGTSSQHRAYLEQVDLAPAFEFGPDLVHRLETTREKIFNEAIPGAEAYCRDIASRLPDELRKNAMGIAGNRPQYSPREAEACRWIGEAPPERPASVFEGASTVKDLVAMMAQQMAQNQASMQQNQLTLNAFSEAFSQKGGQSPEMFALISEMTRNQAEMMKTQAVLAEKLTAKESIVVVGEPETEEEVAPKAVKPRKS